MNRQNNYRGRDAHRGGRQHTGSQRQQTHPINNTVGRAISANSPSAVAGLKEVALINQAERMSRLHLGYAFGGVFYNAFQIIVKHLARKADEGFGVAVGELTGDVEILATFLPGMEKNKVPTRRPVIRRADGSYEQWQPLDTRCHKLWPVTLDNSRLKPGERYGVYTVYPSAAGVWFLHRWVVGNRLVSDGEECRSSFPPIRRVMHPDCLEWLSDYTGMTWSINTQNYYRDYRAMTPAIFHATRDRLKNERWYLNEAQVTGLAHADVGLTTAGAFGGLEIEPVEMAITDQDPQHVAAAEAAAAEHLSEMEQRLLDAGPVETPELEEIEAVAV